MEVIKLQVLKADEGKTIAKKEDNQILGEQVHLGVGDSSKNYIEVDKPEEAITEFTEEEVD